MYWPMGEMVQVQQQPINLTNFGDNAQLPPSITQLNRQCLCRNLLAAKMCVQQIDCSHPQDESTALLLMQRVECNSEAANSRQ